MMSPSYLALSTSSMMCFCPSTSTSSITYVNSSEDFSSFQVSIGSSGQVWHFLPTCNFKHFCGPNCSLLRFVWETRSDFKDNKDFNKAINQQMNSVKIWTVSAIISYHLLTHHHINFTLLFLRPLWSDLSMWGHFLIVKSSNSKRF